MEIFFGRSRSQSTSLRCGPLALRARSRSTYVTPLGTNLGRAQATTDILKAT